MLSGAWFVSAAALFGLVAAQGDTTVEFPNINVGLVPEDQLETWCPTQINTCRTICAQGASPNNCFLETLSYSCTCLGDGPQPNITAYSGTLESFTCTEWVAECVNATMDAVEQQKCLDVKCGSKAPSSATSTPGGGPTSTGSGGNGGPSTTSNSGNGGNGPSNGPSMSAPSETPDAGVILQATGVYGTPAIVGLVVALFGWAL